MIPIIILCLRCWGTGRLGLFQKEAIHWGWELLTEVYGLDKDRLYATVFGGDSAEGLYADQEAYQVWRDILADDKICIGSKKDNFWRMGGRYRDLVARVPKYILT